MFGFTYRKTAAALAFLTAASCLSYSGCADANHGLNPKNPVTVNVWNYYNGNLKSEFDTLVDDFNDTVGTKLGIIVESRSFGSISDLQNAVMASVNGEVGCENLPDIFASYADLALSVENAGRLAPLDNYFTDREIDDYVDSYIEEGRIGKNGELEILPIAKSTEVLILNKTDWLQFSRECGISESYLRTKEGIVDTAEKYYNYTDALTPDIPDDGKAFYGRDSLANYLIIGAKQLGMELFTVESDGSVTFKLDENVMRRLWDCYYVPYINGWFSDAGKYRSDSAKVGDILAYTGSTSSASYFPTKVTVDDIEHNIDYEVLPAPVFNGGENQSVQQGAGMVVTKSDDTHQFAAVQFLKWFTDTENNIAFSAVSGYMPVKKDANSFDTFSNVCANKQIVNSNITNDTLKCAFEEANTGSLYTNKPFINGTNARDIAENSLADKAHLDKAAVDELVKNGLSRHEAAQKYNTDENFRSWLADFKTQLDNSVK